MGNYTVNGYHETNIESYSMYNNKLTEAYYTNCEKIGEQFQLIQVLIQKFLMTSPRCS